MKIPSFAIIILLPNLFVGDINGGTEAPHRNLSDTTDSTHPPEGIIDVIKELLDEDGNERDYAARTGSDNS